MKLFAIGDSITQGFMSGAAARTDLAYPSLVARAMGLTVGSTKNSQFRIPAWPVGGLPINLELVARKLQKAIGPRIDLFDWPEAANVVRSYMDQVEDFYERGAGRETQTFADFEWFHNVAVQGFDVADAWLVTPELCLQMIDEEQGSAKMEDGLFSYPSASFYRTALNVLNPQRKAAQTRKNVLDQLKGHAKSEGVENLLLWLGANNALGTVISLDIRATNGRNSTYRPDMTRAERDGKFNLWGPAHFHDEYAELMKRVDDAMSANATTVDWKVFVGTVPAVSVAPLMAGVGEPMYIKPDPFGVVDGPSGQGSKYFRYYTYFLFDYEFARKGSMKLTMTEVLQIDRYVAEYNKSIRAHCAAYNQKHGVERYIVVDTCEMLLRAAFKRNDGVPTYQWPQPVLDQFPMVDTRFHHAEKGDIALEQGGIFSMDGIHPSAIGQGLIAHEFLKAIDAKRGTQYDNALDWEDVYKSDTLYNSPLQIMGSVRDKSQDLARFLIWATSLKGRGPRRR